VDGANTEAWLESMAMLFPICGYTSNMNVFMEIFQLKGDFSSMVEDDPATIEHDRRRCVMGTIRGMISREVSIEGIHLASSQ
jgi:hypothetical protein